MAKGKKIVTATLAVAIVLGGSYYAYEKVSTKSSVSTSYTRVFTVKKGNITETVTASGTVKAINQYNLNFQSSGKVTTLNVNVGDHVKAGQVLAIINNPSTLAQLESAKANLASAKSKLSQLEAGATSQTIAVQQASVNKAKISLDGATQSFINQRDAYNLKIQNGDSQSDLEQTKAQVDQAENNMEQAKASYDATVAQMNQALAPTDSSTIAQAQASVDQAQASVDQAQDSVNALTITAPSDGIITQVNGNLGEQASSGGSASFIVMDGSNAAVKVTADVSQSDIGKLKTGQDASITTTAFDGKTFTGKVTSISPEATTSNGVTTYSVTISVDNSDGLLRPGMTTSVQITTQSKQNVLTIPAMALKQVNGKDGVYVITNQNADTNSSSNKGAQISSSDMKFQEVQIGLYSQSGVEIVSGLDEGQEVVVTMQAPASSSSSNNKKSGSNSAFGMGGFGGGGFGGGGSRNGGSGGGGRGGN